MRTSLETLFRFGAEKLTGYDVTTTKEGERFLVTTQSLGSRMQPIQAIHLYAYDSLGRVTRYTSPELREDAFSYHTTGPETGYLQERRVDDLNLALSTTFGYDAVGNVTTISDPKGQTASAVATGDPSSGHR